MNLDERLAELEKKFSGVILGSHSDHGDDTVIVEGEVILPLMRFLKNESAQPFNMLIDLFGLDLSTYPDHEGPRFQIVYHLYDRDRLLPGGC